MIQSQPQGPGVMIEGQGKSESNAEQNGQHRAIVDVRKQDARQVGAEYESFRGDDVRHDGADEKAFLALENHATEITAMFEVEGPLDN